MICWPVAAVIFIFEAPNFEILKKFSYNLQNGDAKSQVILFAVVIAVSFIASGLNSIASTSFTREGTHLDMLNYLPSGPGKQISAKVLIAVLFTLIPEVIAIIPVTVYLGNAAMLPLYIIVSSACVLTATMIGVIMDSISPYTAWSDELSALRGNLNCFFNLAAEMIAALLTGALAYGLYLLSGSAVLTIAPVSVLLFAGCAILVISGLPRVRKNIELLK